jgi:peptidyl-prolyl cis-trans isomerase C
MFHRDVAKSTAVATVIDDVAAERRIAVADRQVTDYLARYITQVYGEGSTGREAYVKDLADKGTSEPRVLAELKRQMTLKELLSQVTGGVTVSDEDVRRAFDERKAEFATPERREIHNIVVKTKEEADALAGELKAGGDFDALAGQHTLDGATKANGGNLGAVSARDLQQGYADAAFGAPVGGVFGPIETQQQGQEGTMTVFNIGKVISTQPGAPAEFDKVKDGVKQLLISERAEAQWRDFLSRSIKDADVVYADKYQPEDPDGLPSADNAPPPAQPAPNAPPR